jgi:hypothetical protein
VTSRSISRVLVVLVLAVSSVSAARAQEAAAAPEPLSPGSHVRPLDPAARRVLESGLACSPTLAELVSALEESDLIVGVETRPNQTKYKGEFRIVAATPAARYARIGISIPNAPAALVGVLGHELQHATEVAGAAAVRDASTQRAFYSAVGYETRGGGFFETEAAQQVGRRVQQEAEGCRAR